MRSSPGRRRNCSADPELAYLLYALVAHGLRPAKNTPARIGAGLISEHLLDARGRSFLLVQSGDIRVVAPFTFAALGRQPSVPGATHLLRGLLPVPELSGLVMAFARAEEHGA